MTEEILFAQLPDGFFLDILDVHDVLFFPGRPPPLLRLATLLPLRSIPSVSLGELQRFFPLPLCA